MTTVIPVAAADKHDPSTERSRRIVETDAEAEATMALEAVR
jgi:hypothetical protein